VDDLTYDGHLGKILVSSRSSDQVFAINSKTLEWQFAQTGFRINLVRSAGGRLLAASMFDGVVVEAQGTGTRE
jgi:outer membrane protein assembly factor BamB